MSVNIKKCMIALWLLMPIAPLESWAVKEPERVKLEVIAPNTERRARFKIEIARTPEEKSLGLMHRKTLSREQGMIFVYDAPQEVDMWMKNTWIPLDMLFIGEDFRIIKIEAETKPNSETIYSSGAPVIAVIELLGGMAKNNGIQLGDRVNIWGTGEVPLR